jgi:hypothetical protein
VLIFGVLHFFSCDFLFTIVLLRGGGKSMVCPSHARAPPWTTALCVVTVPLWLRKAGHRVINKWTRMRSHCVSVTAEVKGVWALLLLFRIAQKGARFWLVEICDRPTRLKSITGEAQVFVKLSYSWTDSSYILLLLVILLFVILLLVFLLLTRHSPH